MHLVQLRHPQQGRRVAIADGRILRLLRTAESVYALALRAAGEHRGLREAAERERSDETLDYDPIYNGQSEWRLLPPFDHPDEPARCLVSGTGLTHMASARNRDAMHAKERAKQAAEAPPMTDSMRIFQWGLEGGRPEPGRIGVQPEWFYKGTGTVLRGHGEPLEVPAFADDGGEEPEIAGCYLVDGRDVVRRLGFVIGNEFSDHQMEKKNYLYLAPSKLRTCAVGPELIVGHDFRDVRGTVVIERGGKSVWSRAIATGEANMCHSLANLEHHQFKYPQHRQPGDAHLHFYGADAFSFGAGVALQDGDVMAVAWEGFGRPLRNPIRIDRSEPALARVEPM